MITKYEFIVRVIKNKTLICKWFLPFLNYELSKIKKHTSYSRKIPVNSLEFLEKLLSCYIDGKFYREYYLVFVLNIIIVVKVKNNTSKNKNAKNIFLYCIFYKVGELSR